MCMSNGKKYRQDSLDTSFTIYSIPHTGTHFLDKLLTDHGVNLYRSVHITGDPEVEDWERLIVPLRHPLKVAQSWSNRQDRKGPSAWKQWVPAWTQLAGLRAFFFPIDAEDRNKRLKDLSEYVGVHLETDWTPENHYDGQAEIVIPSWQIDYAESIYLAACHRDWAQELAIK